MKRKYEESAAPKKITKKLNQSGKLDQNVKFVVNDSDNTQQFQMKGAGNLLADQQFQDQFDDEFQEEDVWMSASGSEDEEKEKKMIEEDKCKSTINKKQKKKFNEMKEQNQHEIDQEGEETNGKSRNVFLGNNKQLKKGEVLDFDNRAYDMLHRLNIEWPSLSIDFVYKSSPFEAFTGFQQMTKYPYQIYTVQGSSNGLKNNFVYFNKWTKLHRTRFDDDPDCAAQQLQNTDEEPELFYQQAITSYDINRIRTLNGSPVIAFWNDAGTKGGEIHLMDLTTNYEKLKSNITSKKPEAVQQIIIPFEHSGFALNWNPNKIGELVAGDQKGKISVLTNNENYTAWSELRTYNYHSSSVEDIIFSPDQDFVFASCSSDGTLQIVDMRIGETKKSQLKIKAHDKDVNVADWNSIAKHLIVTGGDDALVKVWDLRMCKNNSEELLYFNWHTEPITSIAFQPNEQSVIAVASEDNRLSIWDMSVENEQEDPDVPNELMFLHQGQQQIKQIKFHPIYFQMIASSSLDSINIFKPNYEPPEQENEQAHDKQDLKRQPIKQQDLPKLLGRMKLN